MRIILCFLLVIPGLIYPLSFLQYNEEDIPGVSHSAIDWGDYNNDGHLDLIITGFTISERITRIYSNNGDGTFTWQEGITPEGVMFSAVQWGDYNNNGLLDVAIAGLTTNNELITRLYRNNGDGTFTENASANLPGVRDGALNWVDFNHNGWLDLFITGYTGGPEDRIARLYQNNGDESFTWREDLVLPGFRYGNAVWGDLNNNGYPDLIIAGNVAGTRTTSVYLNAGGNELVLQEDTLLPGVDRCSLALGDFDQDGYLDLFITGLTANSRISRVYSNNGYGEFELAYDFPGIAYGKGIWADLNNNGLLDVFICGAGTSTTSDLTAQVFLNDGEGSFQELADLELTGLSYADISAVDINNNGKRDLVVTGMISSSNKEFNFYLNQIDTANTIPLPPSLLTTQVDDGLVTLQWNDGTDDETPAPALSYNIWLQQISAPFHIYMSPMADINTGFRKVHRLGNSGGGDQITIRDLPDGLYQWAIQSLDSAQAGSVFSQWQSFSIPDNFLPAPENLQISGEGSQFFLSWDEVAAADLYHIYGTDDPYNGTWEFLESTGDNEWVVPVYHSNYFFRVIAIME